MVFVKTDVSNKESFKSKKNEILCCMKFGNNLFLDAFEKVVETFNQIDILVNSAGIVNEIEWERMIQINLVCQILKIKS